MESFIAVYDKTMAEADVVEDSKDITGDNLEDKVNNERNERDDSYTSSEETKVSEIAKDGRQYILLFLDAIVALNWIYGSKTFGITVRISWVLSIAFGVMFIFVIYFKFIMFPIVEFYCICYSDFDWICF